MSDTGSQPIDLKGLSFGPATNGGNTPTSLGSTTTLDGARKVIAYVLLGSLLFVIVFYAAASLMFSHPCLTNGEAACDSAQKGMQLVTGAMGTVFTAMIGLVGSVVSFYFGSQKPSG